MIKKCCCFIFLSLIFSQLFISPIEAKGEKKVVIILADYLSLEDLTEVAMPNLDGMAKGGGVGLLNTNSLGGRLRSHSLVTIGAGKMALGNNLSGYAFSSVEKYLDNSAGEVFFQRTGQEVKLENMVHLDIVGITEVNQKNRSAGIPGLLGEILHQGGLKTAVIGSGDHGLGDGEYERQAQTLCMDSLGIVDYGYLDQTLVKKQNNSLLPLSSDYQKMGEYFSLALNKADLIVVETGDTSRLMSHKGNTREEIFGENKKAILQEIDGFIGNLINQLASYESLVMFLVSAPAKDQIQKKNLVTPLLLWEEGKRSGYLTSATTRRQGIVANIDIAPTVLNYFSLPIPEDMTGRPIEITSSLEGDLDEPNTLLTLLELNRKLIFINKHRPFLVKAYVFSQITAIIMAIFGLVVFKKRVSWLQSILILLSSFPLAFLLLGLYPGPSIDKYLIFLLFITITISVCSLYFKKYHTLYPFGLLSILTAGLIVLDLILGAPLIKNSILGYDPMVGARYYGLGNEFMGVLIGSLILGNTIIVQCFPKGKGALALVSFFFFMAMIFVTSSKFGANAGGALASLAGFGVTVYLLFSPGISRKKLALVWGLFLFFLSSFALWDALQAVNTQSHFGRTVNLVGEKGISELYVIILRKITTNLRLIRSTIWGQVFLVTLAATILFFYRPTGILAKIQKKYPDLAKGFWGMAVGSVVALVFNDSGIVAAATMSIFLGAPLIYLIIEEQRCSQGK